MNALVQLLASVGGDVRFVAVTEPDDEGNHWLFSWGDGWGLLSMPYRTTGVCDEVFVEMCTALEAGWRADGSPVVVRIPLSGLVEPRDAWARRAMKEMEKIAMARLLGDRAGSMVPPVFL